MAITDTIIVCFIVGCKLLHKILLLNPIEPGGGGGGTLCSR